VVREPSALLTGSGRAAAAVAAGALAALALVDALMPHLPAVGQPAAVAALALVSFPLATLAVAAAAPAMRRGPGVLLGAAVVAVVVVVGLRAAGLGGMPATLAKLVAAACLGYALATLLAAPLEAVALAALVAVADTWSVFAGPTEAIAEGHDDVLDAFTLGFHPPGEDGTARIGATDFLFLALFLGATVRLGLRPWLGFVLMTASFGATMALASWLDRPLPALPLLGVAFVAANADLLLGRRRAGAGGSGERRGA
jgi:hypothetical protein